MLLDYSSWEELFDDIFGINGDHYYMYTDAAYNPLSLLIIHYLQIAMNEAAQAFNAAISAFSSQ